MKLANRLVSFSFDDRTGRLTQIRNRATARDHLADPQGSRLFRIVIPRLPWAARYADSHEAQARLERNGDELAIEFNDLLSGGRRTGVKARVRVKLLPNSPEAWFVIEIHNGSPDVIEQVRFPWVGGWTGLAGPGKDRLTMACEIRDPHGLFPGPDVNVITRCPYRRYDTYPAHLFLPWLDLSGDGEGLSYICYLEKSVVAGLVCEHLRPYDGVGLCLGWSWVSDPFIKPGRTWTSPRVGIGVHASDWHATADRFRTWLRAWHRPAVAPPRLRKSIGFQNLQFGAFDGTDFHRVRDLPRLARESLAYGVADLSIWDAPLNELYLRDKAPDLMAGNPQRLKQWRRVLTRVKRLGCNTSMIFNFRLMRTTEKPFARYGEDLAVRCWNGSPVQEVYTCSHYHAAANRGPAYHRGTTYLLCQTPRRFADRALGIVRKALDLGLTSLYVDQANEWNCCLSREHGHASPDDTPQGCQRWIGKARALVKDRDPEGYLIGEEPDVFGTQNIELWWHWLWTRKDPEVFRYTIPDSLQSWVVDANLVEINRAFVLGFYLAIVFRGMEGSLRDHPRAARHIARLAALRRTCANLTVNARFMDDQGLQVNGALAKIYGGQSLAVIAGDTTGRLTETEISVKVEHLGFQMRGTRARVCSSRQTRGRLVPVQRRGNSIVYGTRLAPFEVQIIELPCEKRT